MAHVGRVGVPLLHLLEQLLLREAPEVGRRPRGGVRQGEGGNIAVASWLTQISKTDNSLQENTTLRQLWDLHKILLFYDCLGYQELENIEHDRQGDLMEVVLWDGSKGQTPSTVTHDYWWLAHFQVFKTIYS